MLVLFPVIPLALIGMKSALLLERGLSLSLSKRRAGPSCNPGAQPLDRLFLETGGESLWNFHQSGVDLDVHTQANLILSDYFVQKADFLKLDHVTLGYNFHDLIGQFLRLSVTMQNILTISNYEGLDPEIFSGIDNSIYPRPRTFVFGLNVEF